MSRRSGIVAVAMLLVLGGPVLAEAPAGRDAAAAELLKVMGLERTVLAGATTMVDAQIQQNPVLAPYRDVLLKWAGTYLTWDAMSPRVIAMYSERFTEVELKEITAFYRTPTGQKALAEMPGLMQKGAALGAEIAKEHTPELEQMIRLRAEELEKVKKSDEGGS